jgi:nicotinate-nucleotide--dimethylbenzimidazole phosphoribosyltransferase
MNLIEETVAAIRPPDEAAAHAAEARLNSLTKPRGSLGRLEDIVRRYAAIRRDPEARFGRGAIVVFVADHGVADEGVSAYPKAVTVEMLRNIGAGGAAICVLARRLGYELIVTDVGAAADTSAAPLPGVRYRRVAAGTRNFVDMAAMERDEARRSLEIGIETAQDAVERGATLIGIGDMGIANSTSAAAILAATSGIDPARIAGRGTGVDDAGMHRKVAAIEAALARHRGELGDGVALVAALGGFEIAAMAGVCIGGAAMRVPVVVDGFIATAAAAIANKLYPGICDYLFFAHRSAEGGHQLALAALGVSALLDLGMRLGEGTGAALAMNVIESALALCREMATFASAGVSSKIQ